jgi:hypothetical protein
MNSHDPSLTPEERDLANRLSRLGPHGGPSPALDAKILAAAHAAVNKRPARNRRHWLGLSGIPGGLMTGVGMAASLTLVLGVVWQLRPTSEPLPQMSERPGDSVEHVIMVETVPSTGSRTRIVEPPGVDAPVDAAADAPSRAPAPASSARKAAAAEPPRAASTDDLAEAEAPAQSPVAERQARQAVEEDLREEQTARADAALLRREQAATREAAAEAPPPQFVPAAPPPPAPAEDAAATYAPDPPPPRRATYTREARAVPEPRDMPAPAGEPASSGLQGESTELDSIVVTGSRIKRAETARDMARIPVHEDNGLDRIEWLERIRERRDGGDLEGARRSLANFRQAHPRVRVPDDLLDLLVPDLSVPDLSRPADEP